VAEWRALLIKINLYKENCDNNNLEIISMDWFGYFIYKQNEFIVYS